ncbi:MULTISPECIES: DUF3954 domain-containing protein [unclassified Terribacillus]|jgi:hypothetical protein|uniref:DUF3954 domain-containing protein n=1 Tax=unclassified Terribacillus TaxID=2636508 RepID=UPI0015832D0A
MEQNKQNVEIDLNTDAVYMVSNGTLKELDKPKSGYGKQQLTWQKNKLVNVEVSYTIK